MDQRLCCILNLIDDNSAGLCDVGTDHGMIPVRLALSGYKGALVATDINPDPLRRAEVTATANNVHDLITFCSCDGLPEHLSDRFDTAVIAGMGGNLICSIIDRADWIFSEKYSMILQPMTKPEIVRYYLVNNGFTISDDVLAEDRGRIYQIIKCTFTSKNDSYSDLELFAGKKSSCNDKDLYRRLLEKLRNNFEVIAEGSSASREKPRLAFFRDLISDIESIIH